MNTQPSEQAVPSADGTSIGFTKIGSGPATVIVHGVMATREQWLPVAHAMAEDGTSIVVDRRGRGLSEDGADYSLDREIEDIEAVLDAAGPDASLLGHSSGAIYALEAARRVSLPRLILYEPPLHFRGPQAKEFVDRIRAEVVRGDNKAAATIFVRQEMPMTDEEFAEFQTTDVWKQMVELAPTFVREWDEILDHAPTVDRYRDIPTPTLLLYGTETVDHPSFATKALEETLPNVRKSPLDGQEHIANVTAPELVANRVVEFLRT